MLLAVSGKNDSHVAQIVDAVVDIAEPSGATVVVAHILPESNDGVSMTMPPIAGVSAPYVLSDDEYDNLFEKNPLDKYGVNDISH